MCSTADAASSSSWIRVMQLKPFNCLLLVLSLSFSLTWNLLTACYQFCVSLTCHVNTMVCSVLLWSKKCNNNNAKVTPYIPVLAGRNLHMSQALSHQRWDRWSTNCIPKDTHASIFFYTSGTPHARHIRTHFELLGRLFRSSLLAYIFLPSFLLVLLLSHFISLICSAHLLFFI